MKYWNVERRDFRHRYTLKDEYLEQVDVMPGDTFSVWIENRQQEAWVYGLQNTKRGVPLAAWRELMADIVETLYS